jgi:hypothetical protein
MWHLASLDVEMQPPEQLLEHCDLFLGDAVSQSPIEGMDCPEQLEEHRVPCFCQLHAERFDVKAT